MIKISVALATWHGEKWIAKQLESLSNQTIPPDEIVICDDSSDNATETAIAEVKRELHMPIRYFRNEYQLGVAANFERALSLCRGDVIFLCDQDDIWHADKIEKMKAQFPLNTEIPAGVFCDSLLADADGIPTKHRHWASRECSFLELVAAGVLPKQFQLFLRRVPAAGHDMAINRALLKKVLPFPELKEVHDNWIGVVGALFDCWRVVPEALTDFRRHEKSLSQSGKKLNWRMQLTAAGQSIADNTFAWNATLFGKVLERFPELPDSRRNLVEKRVQYSRCRAEMSTRFIQRVLPVMREVFSGNYYRFGRSWRSVVQDLFLR